MVETHLRLDVVQPRPTGKIVPLDQLELGLCAEVKRVEADDDDTLRLMAMGVCAGRTIELVKQGDPMILRLFGTRIGVSRRLGEKVLVDVCSQELCDPQEPQDAPS